MGVGLVINNIKLLNMENKITEQYATTKVLCGCGGGNNGPHHPISENGCFRYHVTDPKEIPTNRRAWYNPDWFEDTVWVWDIGDHWVTEYTLFEQRMYHQDDNGNWTRPKTKESRNSLESY